MISIKGLTKKFGSFCAVDNLELDIEDNIIFALLGVNGAGKTTTIKMLCGLILPTSGDANINGFSVVREEQKIKEIINISPQETAIAPNLTVWENIEFVAQIYGIKKEEISELIEQVLQKVHLSDVKNKKSKILSGGMQRRLSIAMALVSNPKIIFLDEPSLGLDVISRRDLWDIIVELKKSMTVILTTHYMEEAEYLADKIGIMSNGKLIAVDTSKNLIKQTKTKNFEDAFIKIAKEGVK